MSGWTRLTRGETTIDFVGRRRRWFATSAVLLAISLLALGVRQLNLGLEFRGGVLIQADDPAAADIPEIRNAVSDLGIQDARIQLVDEGASVRVQTGPLDPDLEDRLVSTIVDVTGTTREEVSLNAVGPTFGALVARQAVIALVVFLAAAAIFITWRLQWKMAAAGLIALAHDMLLTIGVYAVTGFEVTPATVVALLTILGYSLYDTVVVFDRVEEMEADMADRMSYSQIVNRSMNHVLARSLNTSLTSLLPIGSLLFVGAIALGASSLGDFALALFVGIATGTYSSVFIAGPLLGVWKEREPEWRDRRERLERRTAARVEAPSPAEPRPRSTAASPRPEPPGRPSPTSSGARPKPPKRRKR